VNPNISWTWVPQGTTDCRSLQQGKHARQNLLR
jgi:hypothetical protein